MRVRTEGPWTVCCEGDEEVYVNELDVGEDMGEFAGLDDDDALVLATELGWQPDESNTFGAVDTVSGRFGSRLRKRLVAAHRRRGAATGLRSRRAARAPHRARRQLARTVRRAGRFHRASGEDDFIYLDEDGAEVGYTESGRLFGKKGKFRKAVKKVSKKVKKKAKKFKKLAKNPRKLLKKAFDPRSHYKALKKKAKKVKRVAKKLGKTKLGKAVKKVAKSKVGKIMYKALPAVLAVIPGAQGAAAAVAAAQIAAKMAKKAAKGGKEGMKAAAELGIVKAVEKRDKKGYQRALAAGRRAGVKGFDGNMQKLGRNALARASSKARLGVERIARRDAGKIARAGKARAKLLNARERGASPAVSSTRSAPAVPGAYSVTAPSGRRFTFKRTQL